jgi:EmrB/QacA subfamily drug resistance transporter
VEGVPPLSGPARRAVLAAMTASLAMVFLDQTVVAVALPSIRADLDLTQTEFHWVVNGFILAVASLAITTGRISDMLGHPRGAAVAMSIFIGGSLLSGFAQSPGWLIGARILQGAGASMLTSSTVSIVSDAYAEEHRGRALGIYWGTAGLALSLGPLVGGLITDALSWRWIFWVNPLVALAIAPTLMALIRSTPSPRGRGQPVDVSGALILIAGLALLVAGIHAFDWPLLAGGLILAVAFVLVEGRRRSPLLDLSLFGDRTIVAALLVLALTQPVVIWGAVYISDFFQTALGYSPDRAGFALLPVTAMLLVGSIVGGRLTDRAGPRLPGLGGAVAAAVALLWLAVTIPDEAYLPLLPGLVVLGLAISIAQTPMTTAVLNTVRPEHRAAASGLLGTFRQVGGSIGLALLSGVVVAESSPGGLARGIEYALYVGAGLIAAAVVVLAVVMPGPGVRSASPQPRPRSPEAPEGRPQRQRPGHA